MMPNNPFQSNASVPQPQDERVPKRIVGVVAAIVLPFAIAAWHFMPLRPFMDDGPFHGRPTAIVNGRPPDQATPIWGGSSLEVFDSPAKGVSCTVQLRRADGTIQWTILADGFEPGDVRSVRFSSARRGWTRSGTVNGIVDWTYGKEGTNWFITGDGTLREYWYSW